VTTVQAARGVVLSGSGGVWRVRLENGETIDASLRGRLKKSDSGKRADGSLRRSAPLLPAVRPDLDNYVKAIKDALGAWDHKPAIAWFDDGQVVAYDPPLWKVYALPGEPIGVAVRIAVVAAPPAPW